MLQLRVLRLTILTSLAFGAVSTVFSAPLTAQTQQDLPTTVPNLSGYDSETRQAMELACSLERTNGPVAYGACLNRQIASLQRSPGIPNLSGYDRETRQTIELACVSEHTRGPVAYGACLNGQIASLQKK
jgi:hypothetical protein